MIKKYKEHKPKKTRMHPMAIASAEEASAPDLNLYDFVNNEWPPMHNSIIELIDKRILFIIAKKLPFSSLIHFTRGQSYINFSCKYAQYGTHNRGFFRNSFTSKMPTQSI